MLVLQILALLLLTAAANPDPPETPAPRFDIPPPPLIESPPATTPAETITGLTIADVAFGPADIAAAAQTFDPDTGQPTVNLTFTETGQRKFHAVQQDRVGQVLEFRVDGELVSEPYLVEPIEGAEITIAGNFTVEEASALVERLGPAPSSD